MCVEHVEDSKDCEYFSQGEENYKCSCGFYSNDFKTFILHAKGVLLKEAVYRHRRLPDTPIFLPAYFPTGVIGDSLMDINRRVIGDLEKAVAIRLEIVELYEFLYGEEYGF